MIGRIIVLQVTHIEGICKSDPLVFEMKACSGFELCKYKFIYVDGNKAEYDIYQFFSYMEKV